MAPSSGPGRMERRPRRVAFLAGRHRPGHAQQRGVPVVGIFARTWTGRLLLVVVRLVPESFDQEIAAVRDATSEEVTMFETWEANTDEQ